MKEPFGGSNGSGDTTEKLWAEITKKQKKQCERQLSQWDDEGHSVVLTEKNEAPVRVNWVV